MDARELLISIESALEASRALKECFQPGAGQSPLSPVSRSHETALLERVEQTRNDFETVLEKYFDERIKAALSP
ncbi:hypothetical protein BH20ACI3_BH20ACI3_16030 [soil metagenome]